MAEKVEIIEEEAVPKLVENVTENARKVLHAGLGMMAMVQENMVKFMDDAGSYTNKLVEKGENTREDSRKQFNEFVEPYQEQIREFSKDVEDRFNDSTAALLNRFNIPTASSIEDLNKKVAALSRKVDQLKKAK